MYATVIAKGVTDFANNCELLKYGLHWDAVISRWAREHANEVGALDVIKKSASDAAVWTAFGCSNSEEGPIKWEVSSKLQNSLIH